MPPTKTKFRKFRWTVGCINNKSGYRAVMYQRKSHQVHRIIARAFLDNPGNLPTVDHTDRNRVNNKVDNLRWADYKMQANNHGRVINRVDYGVSECEDSKAYHRAQNKAYEAAQRAKGLVRRKCSDGKQRWIQMGGM